MRRVRNAIGRSGTRIRRKPSFSEDSALRTLSDGLNFRFILVCAGVWLYAADTLVTAFTRRIKSPRRYYLVYPKEISYNRGILAATRWLREQDAIE